MKKYRYNIFHYLLMAFLILIIIALWVKLIPLYAADVGPLIKTFLENR